MLGGGVNFAAGVVYAFLLGVGLDKARHNAAMSLAVMIRAEVGKIFVIVGGLWLALTMYKAIVPAAFFAAFAITVIVFSMAFFVGD